MTKQDLLQRRKFKVTGCPYIFKYTEEFYGGEITYTEKNKTAVVKVTRITISEVVLEKPILSLGAKKIIFDKCKIV